MRPGERLHEVLWEPQEVLQPSGNPLIHRAEAPDEDPAAAAAALDELLALATAGDVAGLRSCLARVLDRPALAQRQDGES